MFPFRCSEDDYRRFVQPFIREQCQKIDYTLYHLDGVGMARGEM